MRQGYGSTSKHAVTSRSDTMGVVAFMLLLFVISIAAAIEDFNKGSIWTRWDGKEPTKDPVTTAGEDNDEKVKIIED